MMLPEQDFQSPGAPAGEAPLEGWRKSLGVKLLLAAAFVFGIAAMYPIGTPRGVLAPEGSVWNGDDVISDFSFPIYRPDAAYKHDIDSVSTAVTPIFAVDLRAEEQTISTVTGTIARVTNIEGTLPPTAQNPSLQSAVESALAATRTVVIRTDELSLASRLCKEQLTEIFRRGVVDKQKSDVHAVAFISRLNHAETIHRIDSVYDVDEVALRLRIRLADAGIPGALLDLAAASVRAYAVANYKYDSVATAQEHREMALAVPRTSGIVARGERIVARGDRLDAAAVERLNSYHTARTLRGEEYTIERYFGAALNLFLILILVVFYLVTLRRRLLADSQQLLIFGIIFGIEALLAFASMRFGGNLPMEYLIVVPTAAMLGTILFDSRTGFFFAVVAALIVAGIRGNDYVVALGALVAGGLAAYTVRDIRSRTQLFKSMGYIFLGYGISIVASALEHGASLGRVGQEAAFALLNAVFSPVLTYALLFGFERAFRLTSDLTLLEFDNINHPLLRELSTAAPGTFHHTMIIADMAERAANAIGANAILAKVGAYYHDIGKISSPDFFVENQLGIRNKHERLSPLHSARIIMQHVPDGLALATQHRLPQKIADFIPMHHGTTVIAYFYDRALRRRRREEVRLEDYTYAGPRPRSKETAIVMLADSVEATIRSMGSIDEASIEKIVERTIRSRYMEGQLDECDLTAADLAICRDQFVEILIGIHHPRVAYPDQPAVPPVSEPLQMAELQPGEHESPPPPTEMTGEPNQPHEDPI